MALFRVTKAIGRLKSTSLNLVEPEALADFLR